MCLFTIFQNHIICIAFIVAIILFTIVQSTTIPRECETDSDCYSFTFSNNKSVFCNRELVKCECDDGYEMDEDRKCRPTNCTVEPTYCSIVFGKNSDCNATTGNCTCLKVMGKPTILFGKKCIPSLKVGDDCLIDEECQAGAPSTFEPIDFSCKKPNQEALKGICEGPVEEIVTSRSKVAIAKHLLLQGSEANGREKTVEPIDETTKNAPESSDTNHGLGLYLSTMAAVFVFAPLMTQ